MKFKFIRVLILGCVLVWVVSSMMISDSLVSDWSVPLKVVIYPVNADKSEASADYIASLKADDFDVIADVFVREGARYDMELQHKINIELTDPVDNRPPPPPTDVSMAQAIIWSLMLRYWVWKNDDYDGVEPDVRVFVLYHDPAVFDALGHSAGLEKGKVALVNAFATADMREENKFVMFHEILHTLGATDKYNFANNQPQYPEGYAEPEKTPRFPQRYAEAMGGRIPVSSDHAEMPDHLKLVRVGEATAREIGWLESSEE